LAEFLSNEKCHKDFYRQLESSIQRNASVHHVQLLDNKVRQQLKLKLFSDSNFEELKCFLNDVSNQMHVDIILKPWSERNISAGLLIMDMDSTLIQAETINEIARVAGVGDKVAEITESAMRGELDFTESLNARVSMLKGIALESIEAVHDCLPLTDGAEDLLKKAKLNGCHTALVSGGFTLFADPIAKSLGFDTISANILEIDEGNLTGRVQGPIVDSNSKLETLNHLKQQLALSREQIIAIGDGANDLPMLSAAGTGIAYHAKPKVQEMASAIINHNNLNAVTWLLNWS
jgi:phosphoserine phosphatase